MALELLLNGGRGMPKHGRKIEKYKTYLHGGTAIIGHLETKTRIISNKLLKQIIPEKSVKSLGLLENQMVVEIADMIEIITFLPPSLVLNWRVVFPSLIIIPICLFGIPYNIPRNQKSRLFSRCSKYRCTGLG